MAILITSKKNNFRRCGVNHPAQATVYPSGRFSDREIRMLKAEPMLVVTEIPDPETDENEGSKPEAGKVKGKARDNK